MRAAFATLADAGLSRDLVTLGPAGLLARAGVTWSIDHAHVGDGYGVPTTAARAAVVLAADRGGLTLETTYTGKCLAALRADLAAGAVRGPVLFWLTHAGTAVDSYIKPGWQMHLPIRLRRRLVAAGVLFEQ
jgi:1-aminocyclopropane-1-carboxylate deaminase/D-cysteine desulfhydrase-like pyridoxal-dependent ACC family enzyme